LKALTLGMKKRRLLLWENLLFKEFHAHPQPKMLLTTISE